MTLLIILGVVALLLVYGVIIYNRLVALRALVRGERAVELLAVERVLARGVVAGLGGAH